MKILLLCPHFEPDLHAATGEVMTKLTQALGERGHRVDVVTSLPWYRQHDVEPDWRGRPIRREQTAWGSITRVWPFPTDKANVSARAVAFAGQTALMTAASMLKKRPDVVVGMSPPIFFGNAAHLLSKRFRCPFIFNVQDIFPDVAVELGALSNERVIRTAASVEANLYRRASAVTVLSEDQAANVRAKLGSEARSKVRIIPNFVDTDRVRPTDRLNSYRDTHGLGDRTVVMYSGNVGLSQTFDLVRRAAEALHDRPEIVFVINGEGAARPEVDQWAGPMANVVTANFAPREQVSEVLGAADLHLILLKRGLAASSTPSKLYGILAAARPVLASIDVGSEVDQIVQKAGAGVSVPPEDPAAFISALTGLLADRAELERQGQRGRDFVESWITPATQAEAYEKLFHELLD